MSPAEYQRSNGTFGPNAGGGTPVTGITPQKMSLLDKNELPEGPSIYSFIFAIDDNDITDTLVLGDGTIVNGCALIFDMRNIQQVQKLSAIQSARFNLTSGKNENNSDTFGDWFIQTDTGELFQFGVQNSPVVTGTAGQSSTVNGAINLTSIAPSRIVLFKAVDFESGDPTTVNGVANLVFANYRIDPWIIALQDNVLG